MKSLELLLQNYLSNHAQIAKLDSTFSSWLEILLGVPLGSILGQFLFNTYFNDLLWFNEKPDFCKFADDYTSYSCAQSINEEIKNLLKIVFKKFKCKQNMANPGKFQFMILIETIVNHSIEYLIKR